MSPSYEIRPVRRTVLHPKPRFQVVLVASNGEDLSTSEVLNSKEAARGNIAAQKVAAAGALTVDLT